MLVRGHVTCRLLYFMLNPGKQRISLRIDHLHHDTGPELNLKLN